MGQRAPWTAAHEPFNARMHFALHRVAALAAAIVALSAAPAIAATRSDPGLPEQWALRGDGPMGAASAWARATAGAVTVAVGETRGGPTPPHPAPQPRAHPGRNPRHRI